MPCFHPNYVTQRIDPSSGVVVSTFCGPLKYDDPTQFEGIDNLTANGLRRVLVPCGKCIGCRIDYSHDWSSRLCIELKDNDYKAVFVTLTYDNAHLMHDEFGDPVLHVRDVQLFFKRLRKKFPDKRIRFYLAGEYGPKTHRPHYHAIIYGLSLEDFPDLEVFDCNELGQPYYRSDSFGCIWSLGYIMMSPVTQKTCAYVARYCCKKYFRLLSDDDISVPEFTLCSRRPGIGLLNAKTIVDSEITKFTLADLNGVSFYFLPKAVFRKGVKELYDTDPEKAWRLQYERIKSAETVDLSGFDTYDAYLEYGERVLLNKLKLLKDGANE